MPDTPLSALSNTFGSGYSTSNDLLLLDVLDTSMAATGTDKRITVAQFLASYSLVVSSVTTLSSLLITTSQVSNLGSWSGSTSITTLGTISAGTIPGGLVSGNITGNAASITGSITTSQVSNLSTWSGSTSITTLGTIASGTWQATTVGVQYGGTGANLSATGGTSQYVKQATSGGAFTVGTIAGTDLGGIGSSGQLVYNSAGTSHAGATDWAIGSSGQLTGTAISDPGSPAAGDLWISSSSGNLKGITAGLPAPHGGIVWQAIGNPSAFTAITNSNGVSSLTSMLQSGTTLGSLTIPANTLKVGKIIRPYLWGTSTTPVSPPTLTFAFLVGGNIIWGYQGFVITQTANGASLWVLNAHVMGPAGFQVQSIGSAGTIIGCLGYLFGNASGGGIGCDVGSSTGNPAYTYLAPVAQTINTTVANTIDFQIKYSSSVSGTSMQLLGGWVEILG